MKKFNWPFLIVLAWTFYEFIIISVEVGTQHPAHLYSWSLPIGVFTLLSGLFLFGYLANKMKENKQEPPIKRSIWKKNKDKTVTFWVTIIAIIWLTVSSWIDVGSECKGYTVGWDLPLWSLIINVWMFSAGYLSRAYEYKKMNLEY